MSLLMRNILLGIAVGDALGVPVEFMSREEIRRNPVTDMIGYGTYNLPPGTWSDDTSLSLCLADALTEGYDVDTIAAKFVAWRDENLWTARGHVFDIGIATNKAIDRLKNGLKPVSAGGAEETDNGNGSLMRILPLIDHIQGISLQERYRITSDVSSITHRHTRSIISCYCLLEYARYLVAGMDKVSAYTLLQKDLPVQLHAMGVADKEVHHLRRILSIDISVLQESEIQSSGYVIHTLEASLWCLLTTGSFKQAVLKAVNLGEDSDTTGAVTGGLAGIIYGAESIPVSWLEQLARKDDIESLALRRS